MQNQTTGKCKHGPQKQPTTTTIDTTDLGDAAMTNEFQVQKAGLGGENWKTVRRGPEPQARELFYRHLRLGGSVPAGRSPRQGHRGEEGDSAFQRQLSGLTCNCDSGEERCGIECCFS